MSPGMVGQAVKSLAPLGSMLILQEGQMLRW